METNVCLGEVLQAAAIVHSVLHEKNALLQSVKELKQQLRSREAECGKKKSLARDWHDAYGSRSRNRRTSGRFSSPKLKLPYI